MEQRIRRIFSLFAFFFCFLLANIGHSSWNLNNKVDSEFNFNVNSRKPVAYFNNGNTKREFGTVAGALSAAASVANDSNKITVIVYPDTTNNVVISDCTISNNVTLLINYEDSTTYKGNQDGSNFGDTIGSKSKIRLIGTRLINSGGTLIIGGKTGQNNYPRQGGAFGDCAELNIDTGGSISCSGSIECYGFIHDYKEGRREADKAVITISQSGHVKMPLVRYTYPGGTETSNLNGKGIFPCNVFDLPGIRAPRLFNYGSTLTGIGKVYTNGFKGIAAGYYGDDAYIITSDSNEGFIQLQNGQQNGGSGTKGSVLFDFDDSNVKKTSISYLSHKTRITTNGDFSFSGVSVSAKWGVITVRELDTKNGYLPISGLFDISVGPGVGEVKEKTKRLPGSALKIKDGAVFRTKNNFVAYNSKKSASGIERSNYSFSSPAKINNQGTMEILSGFDGQIATDASSGKVIIGSSYRSVTDCKEICNDYSAFTFFNGASRKRLAQCYSTSGSTCYVLKGNENALANKTYVSGSTADGKYGWTYNNEYKSYPIVIDNNGNDAAIDPNGQKYIENYGNGTALTNLSSSNPDRTFDGYFYDKECTISLEKNVSGLYYVNPNKLSTYLADNKVKVYSKWISGYTVHFEYRKYSQDHLLKWTEINSSTIIKKADLSGTYNLNPDGSIKLSPDYYFEYHGNDSSIPENKFICHYDVVKSVQLIHKSASGESTVTNITSDNIANLGSWSTSDWKMGDTISVIVEYMVETNTTDLSISGADHIAFGKTETYLAKGFDSKWFTSRNISRKAEWEHTNNWHDVSVNKKLAFSSSENKMTIQNKNSDHSLRINKTNTNDITYKVSFVSTGTEKFMGSIKKTITHDEEY